MDRDPAEGRRSGALAAVALAASAGVAVLALFGASRALWWLGDDPALLRFVVEHPPWAAWIDREAVRALPWRVAAPLQLTAYDLDLALFGFDPRAFHLHHLAVLAASVAAVASVAARLWGWLPALAAAAVFTAGAPVAAVAAELMARHYAAGLALAALATGLWQAAVARDAGGWAGRSGRGWAWAGAGAYLLAAAAKEVFVPLPLLLAFLPVSRPVALRARLQATVPFAVALVVYLAWRWWLLGTATGGYGFTAAAADWSARVPDLARELSGRWFATGPDGLALLVATAGAGAVLLAVRRRGLAGLVAGGALALAPIVPLAGALSPRHLLLPWLASAAWIAAGVEALGRVGWEKGREKGGRAGWGKKAGTAAGLRLAGGAAAAGLFLLAFGAAWSQGRTAWAEALARGEREGAEGRFVDSRDAGALLALPAAPGHYLAGVAELRRSRGGGEAPGWFADELYLCVETTEAGVADRWAGRTIWAWRPGGTFAEVTPRLAALRAAACGRMRDDLPLEVELAVPAGGGRVDWRLGPQAEGTWAFVFAGGVDRVDVPAWGSFVIGGRRELTLRVRYSSPEGWIAYSPELRLALVPGERRSWRRAAVERRP